MSPAAFAMAPAWYRSSGSFDPSRSASADRRLASPVATGPVVGPGERVGRPDRLAASRTRPRQAPRPSRRVAVIRLEQGELEVDVDAGRDEQLRLGPGEVVARGRASVVAGRLLGLAERDDVLGQRQDRRGAARTARSPRRDRPARPRAARARRSRRRDSGTVASAASYASVASSRPAGVDEQVAEERPDVGGVLRARGPATSAAWRIAATAPSMLPCSSRRYETRASDERSTRSASSSRGRLGRPRRTARARRARRPSPRAPPASDGAMLEGRLGGLERVGELVPAELEAGDPDERPAGRPARGRGRGRGPRRPGRRATDRRSRGRAGAAPSRGRGASRRRPGSPASAVAERCDLDAAVSAACRRRAGAMRPATVDGASDARRSRAGPPAPERAAGAR